MYNVIPHTFVQAKAQDVCVKLTEDYESRLQTVSCVCKVRFAANPTKTRNHKNMAILKGVAVRQG